MRHYDKPNGEREHVPIIGRIPSSGFTLAIVHAA
jgi:hypothetical protein